VLDGQLVLGLVEGGRVVVDVDDLDAEGAGVGEGVRPAAVLGLDCDAVLGVLGLGGLAVELAVGGDEAAERVYAERHVLLVQVGGQDLVLD